MVNKYKVVLFGGATGDTGKYSMTGETFIFNLLLKQWTELSGKFKITAKFVLYSQRSASIAEGGTRFNQCGTDADGGLWRSDWRRKSGK